MSNESSDADNDSDLPGAIVRTLKDRQFSPIWIVPIAAVLIGLFLVYRVVTEAGPTITITFNEGSGIEAGKTKVKLKDVEIGTVSTVSLMSDLSGVVVTVDMIAGTEKLMTDETQFWVVRPRFSAGGISGLGTLLSGAYIGVDTSEEGAKIKDFVGLERPPVIESDVPGTRYKLSTEQLGGLTFGTPIYYKQIVAGHVLNYTLNKDGNIILDIFVTRPYDQYVNQGTRFWNASGVDVELSANGLSVNTESLIAILAGGIAFDTPKGLGLDTSGKVEAGQLFYLYRNLEDSLQQQYSIKTEWLLYFEDPVRGLLPGAPVTVRGFQIGKVLDIKPVFNRSSGEFKVPVLVEIEPERITLTGEATGKTPDIMVAKGLRAALKNGNLLLGKLIVDLDFHPEAPPASIDYSGPVPVFPTVKGAFGEIIEDAGVLMAELRKIGESINGILDSQEFKDGGKDLAATLARIKDISVQLDEKSMPELNAALAEAATTLEELRVMLGPESTTRTEISQMLIEIEEAAASVRMLADYLAQHPESIVKGKKE